MKKLLLILFILGICFGGYIVYDIYIKDKGIPKLEIMEERFNVNKYYIYGTHLNIEGSINLGDELELVLYNGDFKYIPLKRDEDKYFLSELVNDGLYLDDIPLGKYYLFVANSYEEQDGNKKYNYYAINNTTNYRDTIYYSMSNYDKKIVINSEEEYPTMMITVTENMDKEIYDIVIDPGHGGMDSGAYSGGYGESDFTMALASKIKNKLVSNGVKVKLTREKDTLTKNDLLEEYGTHGRAVIPYEVHAKYAFSLHMNSNKYSSTSGLEIYTAKNINYDFVRNLANNIINKTGLSSSVNRQNKMYNAVYSRNFTSYDIKDAMESYNKKNITPYDVTTESNYYYMIRETGGIVTGAYVDDRNENLEKNAILRNPYYKSNVGVETYLLELGYITNSNDRDNIRNNMNKYVEAIVDSFMKIYKIEKEN